MVILVNVRITIYRDLIYDDYIGKGSIFATRRLSEGGNGVVYYMYISSHPPDDILMYPPRLYLVVFVTRRYAYTSAFNGGDRRITDCRKFCAPSKSATPTSPRPRDERPFKFLPSLEYAPGLLNYAVRIECARYRETLSSRGLMDCQE